MEDSVSPAAQAADFRPFGSEYLADPYPVLARNRKAAPVFFDGELDHWVVSRHEDIRFIFRNPALFSAANAINPLRPPCPMAARTLDEGEFGGAPTLTNADPPAHTRVRKLANAAFTPRRVAAMEPFIRKVASQFLDRFQGGRADFVADLAWELPALVLFKILGVPDEQVERVKMGSWHRITFIYGYPSDEDQVFAAEKVVEFWKFTEELVRERTRDPQDDFISALVTASDGAHRKLTHNEATNVTFNLLFAGHETTTALLSNVFRQLLARREAWEAVCADPSLIPNAVEEVLRYDSSIIAWRRQATRDVELCGQTIPAGAKVLMMLGSANRDPEKFDEPEVFDIHRANAKDQLSFGMGTHLCLGAPLARLEAKIVLEEATRRFPSLRLVPDVTYEYAPNISFRGPISLPVEWDS